MGAAGDKVIRRRDTIYPEDGGEKVDLRGTGVKKKIPDLNTTKEEPEVMMIRTSQVF